MSRREPDWSAPSAACASDVGAAVEPQSTPSRPSQQHHWRRERDAEVGRSWFEEGKEQEGEEGCRGIQRTQSICQTVAEGYSNVPPHYARLAPIILPMASAYQHIDPNCRADPETPSQHPTHHRHIRATETTSIGNSAETDAALTFHTLLSDRNSGRRLL